MAVKQKKAGFVSTILAAIMPMAAQGRNQQTVLAAFNSGIMPNALELLLAACRKGMLRRKCQMGRLLFIARRRESRKI